MSLDVGDLVSVYAGLHLRRDVAIVVEKRRFDFIVFQSDGMMIPYARSWLQRLNTEGLVYE